MTAGPRGTNWEASLRSIGEGLLTIEVNTVEKASMSAQKMPEVPLALHAIIDAYAGYVRDRGFAVDQALLDLATERMSLRDTPDEDKALVARENAWHPRAPFVGVDLTNGPEAFEALQWAAAAALRAGANTPEAARALDGEVLNSPERAGVLSRIRANSRQLREVALVLRDSHAPRPGKLPLFGVGVEATVRALLNDPQPPLSVPLDSLVLVRKAWDVGTEVVMMQTSVQIDGDVVMRISPGLDDAKRAFFADLHAASVRTGLGQWDRMFALVRDLIGDLGRAIFRVTGS